MSGEDAAILAFVMSFLTVFIVIIVLAVAFNYVARWIFYKKCGEEGWKAIIPVYNDYVLIQISGLNWWWILLLYVNIITGFVSGFSSAIGQLDNPVASVISLFVSLISMLGTLIILFARFNVNYNITKKFKKEIIYAILLTLFPSIMYLVIGLSKEFTFDKDVEVSANGVFNQNKTETEKEVSYCKECGSKLKENAEYCDKCGAKVK